MLIAVCIRSEPTLAFSCTMSATTIAFGNVDVTLGLPATSTGTLTLNCSGVANSKYMLMCVSIDGGSAWDSTSRLMNGPTATQLRYQLYSDALMTVPWGSWPANLYGGGYSWTPFGTTTNGTWTATVYGKVLGSQTSVPSGSYTSTVNLFFTYDQHSYANGGSDSTFVCPDSRNQGTASTSFQVTATVQTACSVSATNLNFGTVGSLATNVDATSSVSVQCSLSTPYSVGLDVGIGSGATVSARRMTSGGNTVTYSLYQDSSRTTLWGPTVGVNTEAGVGTGSPQTLTVYGRVPIQALPVSATYQDTIVVTVTY
jgi:spore coat protein U-like protein